MSKRTEIFMDGSKADTGALFHALQERADKVPPVIAMAHHAKKKKRVVRVRRVE